MGNYSAGLERGGRAANFSLSAQAVQQGVLGNLYTLVQLQWMIWPSAALIEHLSCRRSIVKRRYRGGRGRVGRRRYQSLPYSPANKQARVTRIQPGRMLQAVSPRARYASVRRSVYLLAFLAFESGSFPSRAKDGLIRRRRRSSASVPRAARVRFISKGGRARSFQFFSFLAFCTPPGLSSGLASWPTEYKMQ